MLWAWPALASGEAGLIRLHATQFLLLTGAMIVIMIERQIEEGAAAARGQDAQQVSMGLAVQITFGAVGASRHRAA